MDWAKRIKIIKPVKFKTSYSLETHPTGPLTSRIRQATLEIFPDSHVPISPVNWCERNMPQIRTSKTNTNYLYVIINLLMILVYSVYGGGPIRLYI